MFSAACKRGRRKGPRQKTSKIVKKCQNIFDTFRQFSRRAKSVKNRQKVSKSFSTLFDNFRAAPFLRPLLQSADVHGLPTDLEAILESPVNLIFRCVGVCVCVCEMCVVRWANPNPSSSFPLFWGQKPKIHAQMQPNMTGRPGGGQWTFMEEVPRRTSLAPVTSPCSVLYSIGVETEGFLDYQGRGGDHFHCTVEPSAAFRRRSYRVTG